MPCCLALGAMPCTVLHQALPPTLQPASPHTRLSLADLPACPPAFCTFYPNLRPLTCSPDALVFVARTNATIGSKYTKAVYRQYTDATFTKKVGAGCSAVGGARVPVSE